MIAADPARDIRERGHAIRFGIVTPQLWRSWDEVLDLWIRAEAAGFDQAYVIDHVQSDREGDDGPMLEAWSLLAALAREVHRMHIGTFVSGITHRPPVVLAKQAVTLDHLSGGRAILGLGAAWNERDHARTASGSRRSASASAGSRRRSRPSPHLERERRTTYDGRYLRIADAPFEPKPVRGHVPILIGSTNPRMLRIAARWADYVDFPGRSNRVRDLGRQLSADAAATGRDPDAIRWVVELRPTASPVEEFRDRVMALAPLGVSVFLLNVWPRSEPSVVERLGEQLEHLRRRWS